MKEICIATRGSQLALWQANYIRDLLLKRYPNLAVRLEIIKTQGDKILDVALAKVGGKGLFVKEIEEALLDNRADIAVHSLKDVPMVLPEDLEISAFLEREVPYDLFLSEKYENFASLPLNSVLGTSSLRRQAQALALRKDLEVKLLRGNVETRINKMKNNEYDAIILANAGVKRLDLSARYMHVLSVADFLPAVGQGALALETRKNDENIKELLSFLDHRTTRLCVQAERAFMRTLEGGCQVPIAAYATMNTDLETENSFTLHARIATPNGSTMLEDTMTSHEPETCGKLLAEKMLQNGGKEILKELLFSE